MKRLWLALLVVAIIAPPAARAGTLAQFRTVFGDIDVELYDLDKPVTVQNFIRYVQSGAYRDSILHRCPVNPTTGLSDFVVQGGGVIVTNRGTTNAALQFVPTFGDISNEFGVGRRLSNVYGTIAMAKRGGDTNSANSQWFFNLNNNSFLDAADTNNLFVVFGSVVRGTNVLNQFIGRSYNNLFVVFGHVVGGTNVLNVFKTFNPASSTNTIVDFRAILQDAAFGELPLLTSNATFNDLLYVDVSLLNVQVRFADTGAREISWNSVSNKLNHVEFTTGFPPAWQSLLTTNGTGDKLKVTDPSNADPRRFYRVRVDY